MQGLSGGPMIPLSQILLLRVFPKDKAGQAMGLWGMTTVVAPVLGPILGGTICDSFNWPWVFYINVPFALICAALAWRLVRPYETPTERRPVDGVGLLLMVVWVAALEIMLDKREELDWFGSSFIVALLAVAFIGFAAFVIWELTDPNPIVNLRVFRSRGFTTASLVLCLAFGSYFASVVLIPLWLQTNMGYTATWAGIAVAPQGLLAIVFAPIVGLLIGKIDSRAMISFGVLWLALTMFWRSNFASNIDLAQIMIPQFIQGLGVAFFFIPVFGLALGALRPDEASSGAGLLSFLRTMAGAFAVSLTTTAWSNAGIRNQVAFLNQSSGPRALTAVGAAGLQPNQTLGQIEAIVRSQSVMLATDQIFFAIAVIMLIAAAVVWLSPKPMRVMRGAGGH